MLLTRAQQALETPLDQGDTHRDPHGTQFPGAVHLLQGLMLLEPQIKASLPEFLAPIFEAREKVLVSLSIDNQNLLMEPGREVATTPEQTFDEQIESAQKVSDVNQRDELIATTVLNSAADAKSLEGVIQAIDKLSDSDLRTRLLEWLYFRRATTAIKDGQFDKAERLAAQVEGDEQRAFLHVEIARGLLNRSEMQTHAREVLDVGIGEAKKAGVTIFAAHTLLTASHLYAKIDLNQAISVLTNAINCINRIESPDSSDNQTQVKMVERKGTSGQYPLRFDMPGLDPESAIREMAKLDFDTCLYLSNTLTDKLQRAMSTFALADICLRQAPQQPKEQKRIKTSPQ